MKTWKNGQEVGVALDNSDALAFDADVVIITAIGMLAPTCRDDIIRLVDDALLAHCGMRPDFLGTRQLFSETASEYASYLHGSFLRGLRITETLQELVDKLLAVLECELIVVQLPENLTASKLSKVRGLSIIHMPESAITPKDQP